MTELENREMRVLAAARRGLSSSEADRARVRLGVESALAAGEIPDEVEPELEAPRSATLFKAALGLALAVLVGGGGYAAGHRAGVAAGVRERTVSLPSTPSAASEREVVEQEHVTPGPATPPAASASPSSPVVARRATPSASATVFNATPAAGGSDIDEELRILRRVERAQRAGNPSLALALLDELDRESPRGKLMEERAAARSVAQCSSTFGDSRAALLARFRARYPTSVYSPRVEGACAETERPSAGDSSIEREPSR
jgi:hypothetical protein